MKSKLKRTLLLSEKKRRKLVGYARALDGDISYLNKQVDELKKFGCHFIFSEFSSLSQDQKPQLEKAIASLNKGDELILEKLDRVFQSKAHFIKEIKNFLSQKIYVRSLSGGFYSASNPDLYQSVFDILFELNHLEQNNSTKKREGLINYENQNRNLGGRPKISAIKETLVLRLRDEGFSYRTIRAQTGIALSTIRRIIIDSEGGNTK